MTDVRRLSLWLDTLDEPLEPRDPLDGDVEADVAVVGAGYTGLWTAYHLLRHEPSLRVVVVEQEVAGFGASGRNGGWCSALFATSWPRVAREAGRDAALALRHELERTVDQIGAFCVEERVDAHFTKGGTLTLARSPAQAARLLAHLREEREWGAGPDVRWLAADEVAERVAVADATGAVFTPHCAAIHPARLVRGLARAVERRGGVIVECTRATDVGPRVVRTTHGTVRAQFVVRATEGYTTVLPHAHRALAPLWSLMVATEPLPDAVWERIGWRSRETLTDGRHLLVYAQRTVDGRIAFGGRGAPYRFASRVRASYDRDPRTFAHLESALREMFPAAADARITHRWGGVLGVPRDWFPSVGLDRATGLAWAGGYVGDGVGCSHLAGRTLADLILRRDSDLVHLPWVGHRSRRWEPEPLRWAGINTAARVMASADRVESRTGRAARRAALVGRLTGH